MYLATFLFGANSIGLLGLTLQLLIKGKPEDASAAAAAQPPQQQQGGGGGNNGGGDSSGRGE